MIHPISRMPWLKKNRVDATAIATSAGDMVTVTLLFFFRESLIERGEMVVDDGQFLTHQN